MPDPKPGPVFVSYSAKDRARVAPLVEHLERSWSVWWDQDINAGSRFDHAIEAALAAARCAVVAWTPNSVTSQWVRNESSLAQRRGLLIPILLEEAEVPLEFWHTQAISLLEWDGRSQHPGLVLLDHAISRVLSSIAPSAEAAGARPASPPGTTPGGLASRRRWVWGIPPAAAGLALLALTGTRRGWWTQQARSPADAALIDAHVSDGPILSPPRTEHEKALLIAEVLRVAESQVDETESSLGMNRGWQVDEYVRSIGLNPASGFPWTQAFVYWCFETAAANLGMATPVPKTGSVLTHWTRAKEAGTRILTAEEARARPDRIRPGMIFVIDYGSRRGHTGIVIKVAGSTLTTIEGNTTAGPEDRSGGRVRRKSDRKLESITLGFISYGPR